MAYELVESARVVLEPSGEALCYEKVGEADLSSLCEKSKV